MLLTTTEQAGGPLTLESISWVHSGDRGQGWGGSLVLRHLPQPEDAWVGELLGLSASGPGSHIWVWLKNWTSQDKRGLKAQGRGWRGGATGRSTYHLPPHAPDPERFHLSNVTASSRDYGTHLSGAQLFLEGTGGIVSSQSTAGISGRLYPSRSELCVVPVSYQAGR